MKCYKVTKKESEDAEEVSPFPGDCEELVFRQGEVVKSDKSDSSYFAGAKGIVIFTDIAVAKEYLHACGFGGDTARRYILREVEALEEVVELAKEHYPQSYCPSIRVGIKVSAWTHADAQRKRAHRD